MHKGFVNVYQIYDLFNQHKLTIGNFNIDDNEKENIQNEYIIKDDNLTIEYKTEFISYDSLMQILKKIKLNSKKNKLINNLQSLDEIIKYLSKYFKYILNDYI